MESSGPYDSNERSHRSGSRRIVGDVDFPGGIAVGAQDYHKVSQHGPDTLYVSITFDHAQILNASPTVTSIYPGIFVGVGIVRVIWTLHRMYMKWSQTVRDKEFLVKMELRNLEPGETRAKAMQTGNGEGEEDEQEQGEAAVRDLPVLDLIENQSDGESDNEDERFLL